MKMLKLCLVFISLILYCTCSSTLNLITNVVNVSYAVEYQSAINNQFQDILQFIPINKSNGPPRVAISSPNADTSAPLMVIARQSTELHCWKLPVVLEVDDGYKTFEQSARTLCRDLSYNPSTSSDGLGLNPIVTLSTTCKDYINYTIKVDYEEHFHIRASVPYTFDISPSESRYFFYNFSKSGNAKNVAKDSNYDTVILEVSSTDSICMTVSIQNISCPVFDMNQDVTFRGFYETVDTNGGITITKSKFPNGFYVVFVAKPDDSDCTSNTAFQSESNRTKNITMIIKPSISYQDYVNAVVITLSCIGAFCVIFGVAFCIWESMYHLPREVRYVINETEPIESPSTATCDDIDNISFDENEYDTCSEIDTDKEMRLGKSIVYLSDLARKDPRVLTRKSYLYLYNILTVAVFYGLPVIQLVVTYQRVLNETGQQDLCYYNFLCAHPLGVLSDFNHVFSNVGYVMSGVLFLLITHRREVTHRDLDFDRNYGIPQHYGMFYAMGVALIMEGVLSGSYHVCPNQSNFQFDSSFMYVMAVLSMIKLYQNRHPDINARAYTTFGVLAVAILLGMIGIMEGNLYFWIVFTIFHISVCLYLSLQIYYMGCWKFSNCFLRNYRVYINDIRSGPINLLIPTYKARMCLLIIGNLFNWGLASFGLLHYQNDFALFLLLIFMSNTLLYFFFYVTMKYLHKERVNMMAWTFLMLSFVYAISAMYFFLHKSISWAKTPAQSKQYNQECKILHFYDYHDIWHFLSAIGMFLTFMVLLTLDDDLSHTHRSQIHVF